MSKFHVFWFYLLVIQLTLLACNNDGTHFSTSELNELCIVMNNSSNNVVKTLESYGLEMSLHNEPFPVFESRNLGILYHTDVEIYAFDYHAEEPDNSVLLYDNMEEGKSIYLISLVNSERNWRNQIQAIKAMDGVR